MHYIDSPVWALYVAAEADLVAGHLDLDHVPLGDRLGLGHNPLDYLRQLRDLTADAAHGEDLLQLVSSHNNVTQNVISGDRQMQKCRHFFKYFCT